MDTLNLLHKAIIAALCGGDEIVKIYETDFKVNYKDDKSPVTLADKNASEKIDSQLADFGYPFLSEESEHANYEIRKNWNRYWLVDPLDGTKEFIKKNGEFTVNIALIENQIPIIGVIFSPILKDLYFAAKNYGAFKLSGKMLIQIKDLTIDELIQHSIKLPRVKKTSDYTVVASRSHLTTETHQHIERLKLQHKTINITTIGSSLKLCWIAEGIANEYPRFGNIMEWDTAAGHAILKEAGAEIIDCTTQLPMIYNKPSLKNNWFIAQRI